MQFIDLKTQYRNYKQEIDRAIHEVLDDGNYIMGHQVVSLEEKLAQFVGVKHCITVASGTDALLIALMALDVGPGDEVITVPFTWISTAEVISLLGATPVFVDIEADSFNMDVTKLEEKITEKTKAIMPVGLFGQMPDIEQINAIASKYHIPVIEDGAQSFGATQNGKQSCSVTSIGATSFFPAKPLGCYGDGGALFTNDDELLNRMRKIRNHGGERRHHHTCIGLNGRFDTIQAAVILAKLPHYQKEITSRQKIGARYSTLLNECCITPKIVDGNTHVYAQYTIRSSHRDLIGETLKAQGIPTAIYYPKCLHEQPIYESLGYKYGDFPVAEKASQEVISLPMHPWLTEAVQDKIVSAVKNALMVKEAV